MTNTAGRYRTLGIVFLASMTMLCGLTIAFFINDHDFSKNDGFTRISPILWSVMLVIHFTFLSSASFRLFKKQINLSAVRFLFYLLSLVFPLVFITLCNSIPQWIISLAGNYRGTYPGSYTDYNHDLWYFAIFLVLMITLGLAVFRAHAQRNLNQSFF